ncbi:hypothetical protein [Pontibacter sp. G13]|uniref:hypothetical protein n=1 Tax=Pontibacter sp. G13 TaxID=3074898 RepID=UPI00288BCEDB|nr:hypothetical protein [Pontibacter sp. G13]WNJ19822.1 hypothetical protein RJD25_05005 [Pontibacter sp. G13]
MGLSLWLTCWVIPLHGQFRMPPNADVQFIPIFSVGNTLEEAPETEALIQLFVPYASPVILNPEDVAQIDPSWVTAIDLVYTRYPWDFNDWLTDYDWLLENRLKSLYELQPAWFERDDIQWRYILQTDCKSEPEAMQYFHGFVLHLAMQDRSLVDSLSQQDPVIRKVAKVMFEGPLPDSTAFKVLERHPEWTQKLVVMDWTSSMYTKGATVMNWQSKHLNQNAIENLVIFNDGNWTPHNLKKIGKTGGIYHIQPNNLNDVLALMAKVKKNGLGGDPAENDIEALLRATHNIEEFGEVILIPDRNSSIRDWRLMPKLEHPVRIILFSGRKEREVGLGRARMVTSTWVHPHYLTLASITGGSIHTEDEDIWHLSTLKTGDTFSFGRFVYVKQADGSFKKVTPPKKEALLQTKNP